MLSQGVPATIEVVRLLLSLTSAVIGGLVVVALKAVLDHRTERDRRRVEFLTKQLQSLYGPLYFYASQNQQLVAISSQLNDAYTKEYCEPNWGDNESTRRTLDEETTKTIDLINQYSRMMNENNFKMVELMVSNWFLVDPEDAQMLQEFVTACVRHRAEWIDERLATPRRIYKRVGPIITFNPKLVERLRERFEEKTAELSESRRKPHWAVPLHRNDRESNEAGALAVPIPASAHQ